MTVILATANEHLLLEESLAVFWLEVLLLEFWLLLSGVNQHLLADGLQP